MKGRYFPRSNYLKASTGYCPSYTWRSILQARVDVIEKAGIWRVGDGRLINVWEDNWLPYQNGYKIWSPKPPNCDIMFVSNLIHHDIRCWNAPLINEIFLPFEAQQILLLPISFSQLQDEFVWGASRSDLKNLVKTRFGNLTKKKQDLEEKKCSKIFRYNRTNH